MVEQSNFVYVFDLDNTLVRTNKANNLAYAKAINLILGIEHPIESKQRFTRSDLIKHFPTLPQSVINEIIQSKEKIYESFIVETELNFNLLDILMRCNQEGHETILLTYCREYRASQLCAHYNILQYFTHTFFQENFNDDKYSFLKSRGYDLQSVILYENETPSILQAVSSGININNIKSIYF